MSCRLDLGPIGNAYLPSPIAPIGVVVTVRGVGSPAESVGSLFSEKTLTAYTSLYADPQGVAQGIVERLGQRAVAEGLKAEAVLLLVFVGFRIRHRLLAENLARRLTARRALVVYACTLVLVVGSVLVPNPQPGPRIPVAVAAGDTRFGQLTVDSVLLADVLDRGIKGIALLAERQQQAVEDYLNTARSACPSSSTRCLRRVRAR